MKHKSLKTYILSSIFCMAMWMNALASDFQYDGLYYSILSESRGLCRLDKAPDGEKYTGDITVPEKVVNAGQSYTVESIQEDAFKYSKITSLTIEAKITILPSNVCSSCIDLRTVVLPEGLENIENSSFSFCENMTNIILPNSLKVICDNAFDCCKSLKKIIVPEGVSIQSWQVFRNCEALTSIHFSKDVQVNLSPMYMFDGCTSLIEITGAEDLSNINGHGSFRRCTSLRNIVVPHVSYSINRECYNDCISLVDIDFTSYIEDISENAFDGCLGLKSLTFGESLKCIYRDAFKKCYDIETIICQNRNPKAISETAFTQTVYDNATLIVPWNCVEVYKNTAGWNLFKNIVENTDVKEPRSISFDENQLELFEGDRLKIDAKISPADATHYHIEWSASKEIAIEEQTLNDNIASCKITPAKAGTYVLTVKCISDINNEVLCQNVCVLMVNAKIIPTSMTVELSAPVAELYQRVKVKWNIFPEDYTGRYYINVGGMSRIDSHVEEIELYAYPLGVFDLGVSLVSSETEETVLYEPLELEVVRAGGIFDCGEGVIEILVGDNGLTAAIKANEGYAIHSVTMNDADVTSEFADGAQVPVVALPNYKIVFEKLGEGGVNVLQNTNLKIVQRGNVIEITGAVDENSMVTVYDDKGRLIAQTSNHKIEFDTRGVHILSVEGRIFKFII